MAKTSLLGDTPLFLSMHLIFLQQAPLKGPLATVRDHLPGWLGEDGQWNKTICDDHTRTYMKPRYEVHPSRSRSIAVNQPPSNSFDCSSFLYFTRATSTSSKLPCWRRRARSRFPTAAHYIRLDDWYVDTIKTCKQEKRTLANIGATYVHDSKVLPSSVLNIAVTLSLALQTPRLLGLQ